MENDIFIGGIEMIEDNKFTMTLEELVSLDKKGKLVAYVNEFRKTYNSAVWTDKRDKNYIDYFKDSKTLGDPIVLNLTQEGIYQVIDGLHRISLLIEFGKSLGTAELESYFNKPIRITLFRDHHQADLMMAHSQAHSEEHTRTVKRRYEDTLKENRELIEKLLEHDFFKNCLVLGNGTDRAAWGCVEILLAFLQCDDCYKDGYSATLTSSLEKQMKIPYDIGVADLANSTLSLMDRVFKGKPYWCRAVDFCYMALFIKYDLSFNKELTDLESKAYFDEYDTLWYEMEPCVSLNPLAGENMYKVQRILGQFLFKIQHNQDPYTHYI
jgi:hypothetical protein